MDNTLFMFKSSIKESSTINLANVHFPMVATSDIGKSGAACLAADDIRVHHEKHYEMNGIYFVDHFFQVFYHDKSFQL